MSDTKAGATNDGAVGPPATQRPATPAKPDETQAVDQKTQKDAAVDRAENGGYD